MERVLDRLVQFDELSRNFPARTLFTADTLESKAWTCKPRLDQGWEGACVGFGWAHELAAYPIPVKNVTNEYARKLYHYAQTVDEWPGEAYEGTSVLAGAKAVKHFGYLNEYRWAFGLQDVLLTLSHYGPIVFGFNWYEGMMDPDANGFIHPTGDIVGGHCVMARTVAVNRRFVRIRNSWGASWGENGECKLTWDELEFLLNDFGEACVPVKRLNPGPAII